jgi:hypothetical protein
LSFYEVGGGVAYTRWGHLREEGVELHDGITGLVF